MSVQELQVFAGRGGAARFLAAREAAEWDDVSGEWLKMVEFHVCAKHYNWKVAEVWIFCGRKISGLFPVLFYPRDYFVGRVGFVCFLISSIFSELVLCFCLSIFF